MKLSHSGTVNITVLVYVESEVSEGPHWKGRLYLIGEDEKETPSWKATSGPHGKGAAPRGAYQVGRPTAIDPSNVAFRDPQGLAWFAELTPSFKTDRTSLGIHPDGNVPGTQGCIGIVEKDTKPLFDFLSECPQPVVLYVV